MKGCVCVGGYCFFLLCMFMSHPAHVYGYVDVSRPFCLGEINKVWLGEIALHLGVGAICIRAETGIALWVNLPRGRWPYSPHHTG